MARHDDIDDVDVIAGQQIAIVRVHIGLRIRIPGGCATRFGWSSNRRKFCAVRFRDRVGVTAAPRAETDHSEVKWTAFHMRLARTGTLCRGMGQQGLAFN